MTSLAGHFWTLYPSLRHQLVPLRGPASQSWETTLEDSVAGRVRLTGLLREAPDAPALLVVVHGLGGNAGRQYAVRAARAAAARGWSCLRLNLRGADRLGEDLHHAGLTADLAAAVASAEVRRAPVVFLLGYSLGGHIVLRYASGTPDPRVGGVVAVSAPLDLSLTAAFLDEHTWAIYRRHILAGLREMYLPYARRHPGAAPMSEVATARGIRAWDRLTVVPRFGYRDEEDYYARESAGPRLGSLKIPALYLGSRNDPMVPHETVTPRLEAVPDGMRVIWTDRGGHVGFPPSLDLGEPGPRGAEAQVLTWLERLGG